MRWEIEYYFLIYLNWKDRWQLECRAFSGQLNSFKSPVKNIWHIKVNVIVKWVATIPKIKSALFYTIVVLTE